MTEDEFRRWSLITTAAYTLLTLVIAVAAIFGEKIRRILSAPKLTISLSEANLTSHQGGGMGWYFQLKVRNARKTSPAMNTRVLLCRVFKQKPDESWYEVPFSGPVQVNWRFPAHMPQYAVIGPDEFATFGRIIDGVGKLELTLYIFPLNLNPVIPPNEPTRLEFRAVSDTGESKPLLLQIRWDGEWDRERAEIERHLTITRCVGISMD